MKKIAVIIAMVMAMAGLPLSGAAYADSPCDHMDKKDPNYGLICGGNKTEDDAIKTVSNILNAIYIVAGVIAVVVIIIGGVSYITSQGDSVKLTRAKNTILYAVIGLIVTLSAFAITLFIVGAIDGSNTTQDQNSSSSKKADESKSEGEK